MIALFNTKEESVIFSEKIHNYLKENRNGYNADKWSDINKSDIEKKWSVPLPFEYENLIDSEIEIIEKYPEGWFKQE